MPIWKSIKDFFSSKHIQLALVSGASIILLAYVSKRVLPEPIDKKLLTIPPLMVVMAEGFINSKKKAWFTNANFWLVGIVLANILIIAPHIAAVPDHTGNPELEAALQNIVDEFLAENEMAPGLSVCVICPSLELDWDGVSGSMAKGDLEPMTAEHTFRIASNTKTYVAAAVLRLVEMNRLGLDDPLSVHLDAEYDSLLQSDGYDTGKITIAQVLSHTAGLGDHTNDSLFVQRIFADTLHIWTPQEQIRCLVEWREPVGKPGERFIYSDAGYVILGTIITRMTGQLLGPAVRELLDFQALGLKATYWEYMEKPPPGAGPRAHQYFGEADVTSWNASYDLYGGGGIVTDSREMALFMRKLLKGEVLEEWATLEIMKGRGTESYRLGLMVLECDSVKVLGHQGFWNTFAFHAQSLDATVSGSILNHHARNGRELMCRLVNRLSQAVEEMNKQ
jgi:D-alanyl-D-alanine carboxypeptidase